MRFQRLDDWLQWQQGLHPRAIDPGLERVGTVARRLGCTRPAPCVITIAGTNGKGSTLALLEAMLIAAGHRVGSYTSPHLAHYPERVRLQGQPVAAATLVAAFDRIDRARGGISLTYFEFGTLAALDIFRREGLDLVLLEVGMGGRLDATNLVDTDCALVTSLDLDHQVWLGNDRASIAREKAGIFRAGRPALCGDPKPPPALAEAARAVGAVWGCYGETFGAEPGPDGRWAGWWGDVRLASLPAPLGGGAHQYRNAALAVAALQALRDRLGFDPDGIARGLAGARLPGRQECLPGAPEAVLDVAHNPEAARALARWLDHLPPRPTLALLGMMADKDVAGVVGPLADRVEGWVLSGLPDERGLDAAALQARLPAGCRVAGTAPGPLAGWRLARDRAGPGGRVLVLGSFRLVGPVRAEALAGAITHGRQASG